MIIKLSILLITTVISFGCASVDKTIELQKVGETKGDCFLKLRLNAESKTVVDYIREGDSIVGLELKKVSEPAKVIMSAMIKNFNKVSMADNPKGLKRGILITFKEPTDFSGSGILCLEYIDSARDRDVYVYYAIFRRLKRLVPDQRAEAFLFGSFSYDDFLLSIDQLITQKEISLKGEKIIVLDRSFMELSPDSVSLKTLQGVR